MNGGVVVQAFRPRIAMGCQGRPKGLHYMCMLLATVTIAAARQAAAPPDTIFVNAHVVTVDDRFSIAEAVAITGAKFTAVGTVAAVQRLSLMTIDLAAAPRVCWDRRTA